MKPSDNVVYCDNHILVANKPHGMLTQPDETGASSLEAELKAWVKKEFRKEGNVFLHAVHRLDKPVGGLVLFARTSKALSRLNEQVREQKIKRVYASDVEGVLQQQQGVLEHYLIHGDHAAQVVAKNHKDAKLARLSYRIQKQEAHSTHVLIELETGRYHQIRAQFAAIGHPIVGDTRYGAASAPTLHLRCVSLSFTHPVTQELKQFDLSY